MKRVLAAISCAVLAATAPGAAMTVDPVPLEQLVAEADAIVRGFVVAVEPEVAPGPRPRVASRVLVALIDVARGPAHLAIARHLTLVLPGGTTDALVTVVPGVPTLAAGDELVLLLARRGDGWSPLGYHLGTLFVGPDGSLWRAGRGGRPTVALPRATWPTPLGSLVAPAPPP